MTARTDNDLSPDAIVRKVSDSSGSRYSGDSAPAVAPGAPPPIASKPVFTPSRVGGGPTNFTPLGSRSRGNVTQANVDEEGWGEDAPQVTRSQIQRVEPAYKPTKVNMAELTSQRGDTTSSNGTRGAAEAVSSDVVKGGYQPIGKVDIAALRREAKEQGSTYDDRPNAVKGSYEPVGKVDIAAIRARAQPNQNDSSTSSYISPSRTGNSAQSNDSDSQSKSLSDRSAAFAPSERLTSMPKPKVSNKFGSGASSLTGTRAPTPGGFENKPVPAVSAPIGTASKTFADEGGKTPAQQWAEKKARQRGDSGPVEQPRPAVIASQTSGDGGWESGYSGKKWGAVQTTTTGKSATSAVSQEKTGEEARRDEPASLPAGGVSAIRDRFKGTAPMTGTAPEDREAPAPPPMDFSSKPNAGTGRAVPVPGLPTRSQPANKFGEDKAASEMPPPAQPPRSDPPSPEMRPSSPIRIAQPVARTEEAEMEPTEDLHDVPQMPLRSMAQQAPAGDDLEKDTQGTGADPARATAQATVTSPVEPAAPNSGGKRALAQYDYEKAEDNELELKEGEYVNNIDMVDEDWWMGENSRGETGLFPSNYVELVEDEPASMDQSRPVAEPGAPAAAPAVAPSKQSQSALAQYDYEAAEENELSFPDGAKITNVVSSSFARC